MEQTILSDEQDESLKRMNSINVKTKLNRYHNEIKHNLIFIMQKSTTNQAINIYFLRLMIIQIVAYKTYETQRNIK